ncbi:hypothetical protein [Streptomyces sp. NPDC048172]|uniref:hypothetical protein n=1 Tax=Streptomyces sp. NPDC048172 TaxID=3365505 RepID=UPI00371C1262
MEQRVTVHRARLGADEYRVVRPYRPAPRLAVRAGPDFVSVYADREGAAQLLALWALAARSARSLIHLPVRGNPPPDDPAVAEEPDAMDLVLVHHSLQFPTGSWKRLRSRLGPGALRTSATPDDDFPAEAELDFARRDFREYRDHLGFAVAAHTFFVVGSARAFRQHAAELRGLLAEAPSYLHHHPHGHFCLEFTSGPWAAPRNRPRVPGLLHVQFCDTW